MELATDLIPQDMETIKEMAENARGYIDTIYLHWSAGHYGQVYDDYHITVDHDGRIYFPNNCDDLTVKRYHTWQRNSRSIGVCVAGCWDAQANSGYNMSMGSEPVTRAQIEILSILVAVLCKHLGLPISEETVMTHCEIAIIDGYGPFSGDEETRWDLWYLPDGNEMKPGGSVIRGKGIWYSNNYSL